MKILMAAALLIVAGPVTAHNSCNLELDAGVRITGESIEFYDAQQPTYKIVGDKYLVVQGQVQKLTHAQQRLVADYAASIRAALPEVRAMTLAGIDLAIEGVTLAFNGLLGEENQISSQLTTELTNMKSDVNRYFTSGNPISFNHGSEDTPDFLGKQFETRMERIVETSVQNSIGSLMVAVGKEILLTGGSMEAFEQRMNKFGEQMDAQMKAKSTGMEARGEQLCNTLLAIDDLEEQLKQSVTAIEPFNVIRINPPEVQMTRNEI